MLDKIAPELQAMVLANLVVWDSRYTTYEEAFHRESLTALANLCRTCKELRTVVEPFLYRTIVKDSVAIYPRVQEEHVALPPNIQLRQILRTLSQRPELAQHIEIVIITTWTMIDSDDPVTKQRCYPTPGNEIARTHVDIATRIPFGPRKVAWIEALRQGSEDAEVALLLSLLHNVKSVAMALPQPDLDCYRPYKQYMHDSFFRDIFRAKAAGTFQLGDITRFTLLDSCHSFHFLSEVIQLPDLRRLDEYLGAVHGESPRMDAFIWDCPERSSDIESIILGNVDNEDKYIELVYPAAQIVEACKRLQHVSLTCTPCNAEYTESMYWEILVQKLRAHRASLCQLTLDARKPLRLDYLAWYSTPCTSLQEFHALQHLKIHQTVVIGSYHHVPGPGFSILTRILPHSLRTLAISGVSELIVPELSLFVSTVDSVFVDLTTIHLELDRQAVIQDAGGWEYMAD